MVIHEGFETQTSACCRSSANHDRQKNALMLPALRQAPAAMAVRSMGSSRWRATINISIAGPTCQHQYQVSKEVFTQCRKH